MTDTTEETRTVEDWVKAISEEADALGLRVGLIPKDGGDPQGAFNFLNWAAQSFADALGQPIHVDVTFGVKGLIQVAPTPPEGDDVEAEPAAEAEPEVVEVAPEEVVERKSPSDYLSAVES